MLEDFLVERLDGIRRIGFLGLAKNTGKTTAFNFVSGLLHRHGERTGLLTSGRDGETTDLLSGSPKPPVEVAARQMLLTTAGEAQRATADLRPVSETPFSTSVGRLALFEAVSPGQVVLVGPVTCDELVEAADRLLAAGCERVLVDGAINRKAFARPGVVDGVVVCTGAALAGDIDLLVDATVDAVAPLCGGGNVVVDAGADAPRSPVDASMVPGDDEMEWAGAFGDEAAERLLERRFSGTVMVADATRVFLDGYTRGRLKTAGIRIEPRATVPILAVCVNPTSPSGARMESDALLDRFHRALPELPIMDVMTCRLRYNQS